MSAFSFSPEYRLHYPWEYQKFFQNSEVLRLGECVIFRIPNSLGHFRLGITNKAKVNSVQRNRIKRTIREAFRVSRSGLGSFDYNVVIPSSKRAGHIYFDKLQACLAKELIRAARVG